MATEAEILSAETSSSTRVGRAEDTGIVYLIPSGESGDDAIPLNGAGALPNGLINDGGKLGVPLEFPKNSGEILLADMPMDTDADANTFHGYVLRVGDKTLLKLTGKSDNSGNLSNVAAESEAFKLVDGGDQESTAFSLGFPAFKSIEVSSNTTTSFTLPPGVLIREVIIAHTSGTGVNNIVASGLSVKTSVSQNTFIPQFNMERDDTVILSPSNAFPVEDSQGEALVIEADTWHNSSVKLWVYYQFLP